MDIDLTQYTNDQLAELCELATTELDRRHTVEQIPAQMKHLADIYRDGGGDPNVLLDVLTEPATDEQKA